MHSEMTWQEHVKNASAHKQLGHTKVYLMNGDAPWEFATSCESGSSHRIDIATSVSLTAAHPCGLTFYWSLDLEKREANGLGYYMLDRDAIRAAFRKLPDGKAKQGLRAHLKLMAATLRDNAAKYQEIADRERAEAAEIELL